MEIRARGGKNDDNNFDSSQGTVERPNRRSATRPLVFELHREGYTKLIRHNKALSSLMIIFEKRYHTTRKNLIEIMKKIIKKSAQVFLLQSILFPWSFGIRYLSPYSVYPLFYTLRFKYTLL